MDTTTTDRIEKEVVLKAPRSRVWRAISDPRELGAWFRAVLVGPFEPGATVTGHSTYPGWEHLEWQIVVEAVEPERLLSFRWHPYAVDPDQDYTGEPTTLVTFVLEQVPEGTRLTVTESGFDGIPLQRRAEAFRMNSQGWATQMENVAHYVAERS
ncbi:MAG: SRPBCC family protein [Acidobacteria bacterium]|nr:SRPBCC family protein [Acidobacteriota bacterium]